MPAAAVPWPKTRRTIVTGPNHVNARSRNRAAGKPALTLPAGVPCKLHNRISGKQKTADLASIRLQNVRG